MMRRALFFGLTLVLVLAFVFLSVRGCRQGEEPASSSTETVEKSESSATRVLQPQDLEITLSKMALEKHEDGAKPSLAARHEIEIFNHGNIPYRNIRLTFVYLSRAGKVLETRNHSIDQSILPGAVLKLADLRMDGLFESTTEARISIPYADVGIVPEAATPHN
ncbi:MAG TPA: hypothetical protein VMG30_16740 [Acidobacteriota bacterium]|nr:hypothetical protein [Acidobacteriota bacterium]